MLGRSLTDGERAEAFQLATYQTRAAKGDDVRSTGELRTRWRDEASSVGYPPAGWLPRIFAREPARSAWAPKRVVRQVIATLEQSQSTWGRADVIEALSTRVPPAAFADAERLRVFLEAAADAVIADHDVVRLGAGPAVVPEQLARQDGMAPAERHGAARYSTRTLLQVEQAILAAVDNGRTADVAVVAHDMVRDAADAVGLGADQARAVERICAGGEQISVLIGRAGAGKSRALAAARMAWHSAGMPVRGLAPSAAAAGVLTEQAGIPAETVAKFVWEANRGRLSLRAGEVIVCDEASMLATRDLARLVVLVARADAKLVLVGDPKQLGSVDAGGLFRLLAADAKTAELTTIRRFTDPWEADATRRLRAGDQTVLSEYECRGRVLASSRDGAIDGAWRGCWLQARSRGKSVVVMATDHDTVDRLALRSRAARVAAGESNSTVPGPANKSSGSATRSSPPATPDAWSPAAGLGSATVTAGGSTGAQATAPWRSARWRGAAG